MRALKMSNAVAGRRKLTMTNWEQSPKLILLQLHERWLKSSASTILWSILWHLKQIGEVKKFGKGVLYELTTNQKNCHFEQQTISQSDYDVWWKVDCIQLVQWLDWKRLQSKADLHQKCLWSLFGGLLSVWYTTVFWIPGKPLHLRSMLSKWMRCIENHNTCSQHWSTERAQFSITMPDHTLYNQCFKRWTNWTTKFCLIHHIHLTSRQLTTTSSGILTTFFRENLPTTSRKQKMLSKSLSNLKHRFLCYRNKQTYLIGKNVLIIMVPILINKGLFEPIYNDLKFMVQNRSYICTNLITHFDS